MSAPAMSRVWRRLLVAHAALVVALTSVFFDGLSPLLWSLVTFGPAWLNVLLHVAVFLVVSRARRR
jgi:hypothetical protein